MADVAKVGRPVSAAGAFRRDGGAAAVSGRKAQDFPDLESAAHRKFLLSWRAERIPAYSERRVAPTR